MQIQNFQEEVFLRCLSAFGLSETHGCKWSHDTDTYTDMWTSISLVNGVTHANLCTIFVLMETLKMLYSDHGLVKGDFEKIMRYFFSYRLH